MSYELKKPYTELQKIDFISSYNHGSNLKIVETNTALYALQPNEIMENGKPIINPNYEAEQKAKEKERISELKMTRSDFFDGAIDAWGISEEDLLLVIKRLLGDLPFETKVKLKAINNFNNALHFYRKHTLFNLLINSPIPISESEVIVLTEESLDAFFDEMDKGNKDTAWTHLPKPIPMVTGTTE